MAAFRNLCGDASEARACEALAPYYKNEQQTGDLQE
jgi:hypothetical protein